MPKLFPGEIDEILVGTSRLHSRLSTGIALITPMQSTVKYLLLTTLLLSFQAEGANLGAKQKSARLNHAKELLGSHYKKSSVRVGEKIPRINKMVYAQVKERLPKAYQAKRQVVAQTIIDEAFKYKFDPIFILSVIQSESSFRPRLFGSFGEIGLMQIKPSTAAWITKKMDLKYKDENDLYDPVKNIRIGAAFLSYLRDRFDSHAQLYLSAYNMGQGNVDKAQAQNIWPKDYVERVMKQYVDFYANVPTPSKANTLVAKTTLKKATPSKSTLASKGPIVAKQTRAERLAATRKEILAKQQNREIAEKKAAIIAVQPQGLEVSNPDTTFGPSPDITAEPDVVEAMVESITPQAAVDTQHADNTSPDVSESLTVPN